MATQEEQNAQELQRNKAIDGDFERVTREHSNIFDFLWEEPRLAWDGGWIPVCGSILVAFHISRTYLWPKILAANASRFGAKNSDTMAASRMSPFQKTATETTSQAPSKKLSVPQMMFEVGTGFVVGGAVNYLTNDRSKVEKTVVAMPLKDGKSRLCDKLCPALVAEYERQWNLSEPTRQILKEPTYENLKVTLEFVRNCQQRHLKETGRHLEASLVDGKIGELPKDGTLADDEGLATR